MAKVAKSDVHHPLITKWRACDFAQTPYLYPEDEGLSEAGVATVHASFKAYVQSNDFESTSEHTLHTGLLPVPYRGDLQNSSVFILMLNPGLTPVDYFAEYKIKAFREALLSNIRQDNGSADYPFTSLDPTFAWQSSYWRKKLRGIAHALQESEKVDSYQSALQLMSRKISCLQLVPYHSKKFRSKRVIQDLRSRSDVISYVQEVLKPKAQNGKALVVVARGAKFWGLATDENIIICSNAQARAVHLGLNTQAGKAIARRLGAKEKVIEQLSKTKSNHEVDQEEI